MAEDADAAYLEFVASHHDRLLRTARLLAAGDTHWAEDLVQTTLTKLYVHWGKVSRTDGPARYTERMLVNSFIDERRRLWRQREISTAELTDPAASGGDQDVRLTILTALAELPHRQRAAVILRYFRDLDVAAVADLMGCGEGTVKSQTSRGLDKLRGLISDLDTAETSR